MVELPGSLFMLFHARFRLDYLCTHAMSEEIFSYFFVLAFIHSKVPYGVQNSFQYLYSMDVLFKLLGTSASERGSAWPFLRTLFLFLEQFLVAGA